MQGPIALCTEGAMLELEGQLQSIAMRQRLQRSALHDETKHLL